MGSKAQRNTKAFMSSKAATKSRKPKRIKSAARIVWFEIPVDDPKRAQKFYRTLFGWKIKKFPGMKDYWHIDTGGGDDTPDGGLMARKHPQQPITNYVFVDSVDASAAKVEKLGGKVCLAKTAVPGMGYFAMCHDTEHNTFALWEMNPQAK
jgi:predicted enzyme related to lactoylglutathione lyase